MNESNITKEGIEVKPGQIWRDLDGRMDGRQRSVIAVFNGVAVMCRLDVSDNRTTRVAIRRMHKSSTGWALVLEGAAQ